MNKKANLLKKRLAVLSVLFLLICMTAPAAASSKKNVSPQKSASLKNAEKEKEELESELSFVRQTISELKQTKGNVEDKIVELNSQLVGISARIEELENELTQKNEDILAAREALEAAKLKEEQQYEDMKVRIQYMYENSHRSYMEVFVNAQNIVDLLNMVDYISQIQSYDRQKLEEYEQTVADINEKEERLKQDYEDLEMMKQSVEENKASVAAMMRERENELLSLSADIGQAQSEAAYFEAEIQAQEEVIAAIKRAEAEKAAAGVANHAYTGGPFLWPCPSSTRVTSEYGPREVPTTGASADHKGIDIGAAGGADIIAAADGTVRAATYSSAAGNYVMIDHGSGLYTVYMHASALLVSAGDEVKAGAVIAKVGSTGISTGNHLHFGVSLNGVYVSPWSYLGG